MVTSLLTEVVQRGAAGRTGRLRSMLR